MCRLLGLWAKQEKNKTYRHLLKDWFIAWLNSTKNDHYLNRIYGIPISNCVHKDGWGVVTLGTDPDCKIKWEHKNHDLEPAFSYRKNSLVRSILGSPFLKSTHQILLAHARRASVNMPVTYQQVQPLLIHTDKSSRKVFLSHNGTLNSKILNDMLESETQPISTQVKDFSDTQILCWYIKQKLKERKSSDKNSIEEFWVPILQEIIDKHQDENTNYQMQLIMAEIIDNQPQLIICSALSDKSKRFMPYYQLFIGKREGFRVICSSTIVDTYSNRHDTSNWGLDPIENKTLIHLTLEGEFFYKIH
ncbi:MAG: class II glutamine amidotransferase [Candidatus Hodarchaeales archaeon]|jgi:predicted glutamine amidotransferase